MVTEKAKAIEYQNAILPHVSRTFALTIPQLPDSLQDVVGNSYLLCRIADTIEDEPALTPEQKILYLKMFSDVVAGRETPELLAEQLHPLLSDWTLKAERNLVENTPIVIGITHDCTPNQRDIMERCITTMSTGMAEFCDKKQLATIDDLTNYCYYVAGVVGELLTDLFCDFSDEIARSREKLIKLSVSFGNGLQMVNILKDVWVDASRGVTWLPAELFRVSENDDGTTSSDPILTAEGMRKLISTTYDYLSQALQYSLMIPTREVGIRRFLLWTLGMAVLTLRRINKNPNFQRGDSVKISRKQVATTTFVANSIVGFNFLIDSLFRALTMGLSGDDKKSKSHGITGTP